MDKRDSCFICALSRAIEGIQSYKMGTWSFGMLFAGKGEMKKMCYAS